jgi:hypothetical protein
MIGVKTVVFAENIQVFTHCYFMHDTPSSLKAAIFLFDPEKRIKGVPEYVNINFCSNHRPGHIFALPGP